MKRRRRGLRGFLSVLLVVLASVVFTFSVANIVPASKADELPSVIDANALKPDECAALNLTAVVLVATGTSASELILGTAAVNSLNGASGDDCILGGAGDDSLVGGPGIDVCIGGPDNDTYDATCETQVDTGPVCSSPGTQTIVTNADSWVDQGDPTKNNGTDSNLFVQSKTPNANRRTLIGFNLPSLPSGCSVSSATLRVFAKSAEGTRTIQAFRAAASWTEGGVTWNNQPATTGAAATSASGTGWRTWTVTSQVQGMYASGAHGFILKDETEDSGSFSQNYASLEDAPNDPELVISWA